MKESTKQKLALTPYQKDRLQEFKDVVLKLRNAGVLPLENRYTNHIYFVNGLDVDTQYVNLEANGECPFTPDDVFPGEELEEQMAFDVMFANYFLPKEDMFIKFKE